MEGTTNDPFVLFSYIDVSAFSEASTKPTDSTLFIGQPPPMFIQPHPSPMQSPMHASFKGIAAPDGTLLYTTPPSGSRELSGLIQEPTTCFLSPTSDQTLSLPSPQVPLKDPNFNSIPTPPDMTLYMPPSMPPSMPPPLPPSMPPSMSSSMPPSMPSSMPTQGVIDSDTTNREDKKTSRKRKSAPLPYALNMVNLNLASPRRITKPPTSQTPRPAVPYMCEFPGCEKTFTRPYNLKSHHRTHTDERPFTCHQCKRRFARQHDRNRHSKLHLGIKPYPCCFCGKDFARQDALNRHQRIDPTSSRRFPPCLATTQSLPVVIKAEKK